MTIDARGGVDRMKQKKTGAARFSTSTSKYIIASNIIIGFSLAVGYSIDYVKFRATGDIWSFEKSAESREKKKEVKHRPHCPFRWLCALPSVKTAGADTPLRRNERVKSSLYGARTFGNARREEGRRRRAEGLTQPEVALYARARILV